MTGTKRIRLILVFVGVFGFSMALGESVLKRVTAVEDPELGEILRIALENMPEAQKLKEYLASNSYSKNRLDILKSSEESAKVKTARVVTEIYSQVRLLDEQIDTTMRMYKKAGDESKGELGTELLLAAAELKAERVSALADLRVAMNIVPKFAFSTKATRTLNSWIELSLIEDSIYVYEYSKPFYEYKFSNKTELIGKKSRKEIYELLKELSKDKKLLPVRVDISNTKNGSSHIDGLREAIVELFEGAKVQIDAEVHVDRNSNRKNEISYEIIGNEVFEIHSIRGRNKMIRNLAKVVFDGDVKKMKWLADEPWRMPREYILSCDEQSKELAEKTKKVIMGAAKENGVGELVTVTLKELEKEVIELFEKQYKEK